MREPSNVWESRQCMILHLYLIKWLELTQSTLCVCGDSFNLQHALSCPKGGLVITRHNKLRNLTAEILG